MDRRVQCDRGRTGRRAVLEAPEPLLQDLHGAAMAAGAPQFSQVQLVKHVDVQGLLGKRLLQPGPGADPAHLVHRPCRAGSQVRWTVGEVFTRSRVLVG